MCLPVIYLFTRNVLHPLHRSSHALFQVSAHQPTPQRKLVTLLVMPTIFTTIIMLRHTTMLHPHTLHPPPPIVPLVEVDPIHTLLPGWQSMILTEILDPRLPELYQHPLTLRRGLHRTV
uniref:Uncharacterized protein n=1 Tax=Cacopsylla melanoneura TaxID=428564 RepID=A0A8D9F977_9HEMI